MSIASPTYVEAVNSCKQRAVDRLTGHWQLLLIDLFFTTVAKVTVSYLLNSKIHSAIRLRYIKVERRLRYVER